MPDLRRNIHQWIFFGALNPQQQADLADFSVDPSTFLNRQVLDIGSGRLVYAWSYMAVLVPVVIWLLFGRNWVGFCIGIVLWLLSVVYDLKYRCGHWFRLTKDELQVWHANQCVRCPWHLFDCEGRWVDDGLTASPSPSLRLPIRVNRLTDVKCEINGHTAQPGTVASTRFFRVYSDTRQVHLKGLFELSPEQCGDLIMQAARAMQQTVLANQKDATWVETSPIEPESNSVGDHWVHVSVTNLPQFPDCCCVCGGAVDCQLIVIAEQRLWRCIPTGTVELALSTCQTCAHGFHKSAWLNRILGGLVATTVGSVLAGAGAYLIEPTFDLEENVIRFGMGAVFGLLMLAGPIERLIFERRLPLRASANLTTGQLSIYFRQPDYVQKVR